jgi:hypothetical protein
MGKHTEGVVTVIRALMLGSGTRKPVRDIEAPNSPPVDEWVTLDIQGEPDLLFDLNRLDVGDKLPFPDGHFDEIHAYEVLEHFGRQGNWRGFFGEFQEFWRLLKPSGAMFISVPPEGKTWDTDPGHTRYIGWGVLAFLMRSFYDLCRKEETVATDYSSFVDPCWWQLIRIPTSAEARQMFVLKKAS